MKVMLTSGTIPNIVASMQDNFLANIVETCNEKSDKSNIQNLDIKKFNKEYPILKVKKTSKFHDRFIVIDDKEIYHLGASIKDLGKKCFAINKIEDIEIIEKLDVDD